jgi:hypothetical protein
MLVEGYKNAVNERNNMKHLANVAEIKMRRAADNQCYYDLKHRVVSRI